MFKKLGLSLAAVAFTAAFAMPAMADGKTDCTTEPQEKWKKLPDAEAAAKAAGFEVRNSKLSGSCLEVYAVKDGKNLELFYNPVDLKLEATVTK
jgi:hypothetical protein